MLDLTSTPPVPLPQFPRFRREETVVDGAMASTYRARDVVSGQLVTLTQVHAEQAADGFFVARFEREVRLLAAIDHPNVVRLVASGVEDGIPFVATEHIPGRTVADVTRERGAFAASDAARIARQVLAGLGAMHDAGLLHLRLSPRTILLCDDGLARITEVGIAGLSTAGDWSERGAGVEEARYLAPELIEGGNVCEGTDLYAVGAVLFEALTGQPPFPGTNPVLVRFAQLQAPPPVPSQIAATAISPTLDAVVVRALAKDPAQRFEDARAMAAAMVWADAALVDRIAGQRTLEEALPPAAIKSHVQHPSEIQSIDMRETGLPTRSKRGRQPSAGWMWPLLIAGVVIAMLIGALVASLSSDVPADEAVAGVSTFAEDPTRSPTTAARAKATPTVRVMRASKQSAKPADTRAARKTRTPEATRTPRPTRTPEPAE